MEKIIRRFEQCISFILMFAVMAYIGFQVIVLVREAFMAYYERVKTNGFEYTQLYGGHVFVVFFNILLALEVLETVKVFNKSHDITIRIILIVCLIAVSRKILAIHIEIQGPEGELAVAALVTGLSASYFLVVKSLPKKIYTKTSETDTIKKSQY